MERKSDQSLKSYKSRKSYKSPKSQSSILWVFSVHFLYVFFSSPCNLTLLTHLTIWVCYFYRDLYQFESRMNCLIFRFFCMCEKLGLKPTSNVLPLMLAPSSNSTWPINTRELQGNSTSSEILTPSSLHYVLHVLEAGSIKPKMWKQSHSSLLFLLKMPCKKQSADIVVSYKVWCR